MRTQREMSGVLVGLALAAAALAGCDDGPAEGVVTDLNPANAPSDDGARVDAGTGADAAVASGCVESAPRFSAPMNADGRGFDLVVDGLDAHVLWSVEACPAPAVGAVASGHALRYARFGTSGDAGQAQELAVTDENVCARVRAPSLVLTRGADGVDVGALFLSTRDGPWGVYRMKPGSKGAERVTLAAEGGVLRGLVASHDRDAVRAAWIERASDGSERVLGLGSVPQELVPATPGAELLELAWGGLGRADGPAPVLAFATRDGADTTLHVQALDADGAASGAAQRLAQGLDPAPGVDLGPIESGAGVVFTTGQGGMSQVRYLELDAQGAPAAAARKLTAGAESAEGPSFAPFAGGFVVAFRVSRPDRPDVATLRLAFIDAQGNVAGVRDVLETSPGGGRVHLQVAVDGRLVLGFAQVSSDGRTTLEVARVTCSG